jgi:hypothetical protein
MANRTPICTNLLAAEDNPALCLQRMFYAASLNALQPPRKGGTDEIDIIIDNIPTKLITD